jgi:lysophospholipase L1-like esterase
MNLERYAADIDKLCKKEIFENKIMFYGNSYFNLWSADRIERMLSELGGSKPVAVNNSFGGATSAELLHYYDQLVKPYKPRLLLWTEGANDFAMGFTGEEASEIACTFFNKLKSDFPTVQIMILSPIETPNITDNKKIAMRDFYKSRMNDYAEAHENCSFVDISPFFYNDEAKKCFRDDIFIEDNVHLNDHGYDEFERFLKKTIIQFGR